MKEDFCRLVFPRGKIIKNCCVIYLGSKFSLFISYQLRKMSNF
uniref:Uncharacterized protein n=1 Tax=Lepeophtheirus salmonis TaxID=72036 RepID=A0A0K2TWH8_LEPSM